MFQWGGAPDSLTVAECGNRALLMAADGRRVWAWHWDAGGSASHAVLTDVLDLPAERIALLSLDNRHFLPAAGREVVLHEVHPQGERLLGASWPLGDNTLPARAVAALAEPQTGGGASVPRRAWLACTDGRTAIVWRLTLDERESGPEPVLSLRTPARGLALGRWADTPLLVLHEDDRLVVHGVPEARDVPNGNAGGQAAGQTALCVFEVSGHRHGQALACDPEGTGRIAAADGPDVRILDVASAAEAQGDVMRRRHDEHLMVGLAAGPPGTPPLLCRAAGGDVVVSLVTADGNERAHTELRHEERVTAVRAVWHAGRWLVATAFGRTVRVWSVTAHLGGHRAAEDFFLKGDVGDRVRGLELVVDGDGTPALFFPDSRLVVRRTLRGDEWKTESSVPVVAHAMSARAMADGQTRLVVDTGRGFRLWETGGDTWRELPFLDERGKRTAAVALGEHHLLGESVPLLAWADEDWITVARHKGSRWVREQLPYEGGKPTALLFSGSPERPLLVVCGGERTLSVLDATNWRRLDSAVVSWRGLAVEAAGALFDEREGIVLALQGRQRCDLLLLKAAALRPVRGRRGGPRF